MGRATSPTFAHFVGGAVVVHAGVLCVGLAVVPHVHPSGAHGLPGLETLLEAPAFAAEPLAAQRAPDPAPEPPIEKAVIPSTRPSLAPKPATRMEGAMDAAADAIAAAVKVLTRDDDSPATTFASGNDGPGYGLVAGDGQGMQATRNRAAAIGGKRGGTGQDPRSDSLTDRSRAARVIGGYAEDCDFPPEAGDVNRALVSIVVDVRSDGSAAAVTVVSDPGHGFGRSARTCALRRRFDPARDREGHRVPGRTAPITVRFTR